MLLKCALFSIFLVFLVLPGCIGEVDDEINKSVDVLLESLWDTVHRSEYSDGIPFAGIDSSFKVNWFHNLIRATIKVVTSRGRLQGLDSLRRVGDVQYSVSSTYSTLNLQLQASDLVADFDKVTISTRLGKATGSGSITVKNIIGGVKGTVLQQGNSCVPIIEDIWVDDIDDVEVNLSGFFLFDHLMTEISTNIVKIFERQMKTTVREYSKKKVSKFLEREDVCPFLDFIK